jgi:hypothetical protein
MYCFGPHRRQFFSAKRPAARLGVSILCFAVQMRIAMVALALLTHFDEPFGEPFAGNRGLSFTGSAKPVSVTYRTGLGRFRNGNWKMASRDWRRQASSLDRKFQNLPARDSGAPA